MTYLGIGARVLIGVVFAVAFVGKVRGRKAFDEFVRSTRAMGVLPAALVRPVSFGVVAAELLIVLALAVPTREAGALGFGLATALLAAFTVGIAVSLARGKRASCRCFGDKDTPLRAHHVGRDLALIAVALVGLLGTLATTPVDPGVALVTAVAGALLAGLVVMLDDILAIA